MKTNAKTTVYTTERACNIALEQARGTYQRALLQGHKSWGGSDLKGKARKYSARYHESRQNLRERMKKAGLEIYEHRSRARKGLIQLVVAD